MRISKFLYIVGPVQKNKIYYDFHALVFLLFYSFEVFKIKYVCYIFFHAWLLLAVMLKSLLMGF